MTPFAAYQTALFSKQIEADPDQQIVIQHLTQLHHQLISKTAIQSTFKRHVYLNCNLSLTPVKGLYLWGGVGRGKTYLMDLFYQNLPFQNKTRLHFHRFIHQIHQALIELKGVPDPLKVIAKRFAKVNLVLCFDEFFVKDIADAMMLGQLLQYLFHNGVTLVATSNMPPDALYPNGLQRERFIPAIDAILTHCAVWELKSPIDYRLRYLEQAELYHFPLDEAAEINLRRYFNDLARINLDASTSSVTTLMIAERPIQAKQCAESVVWFDFDAICRGPRSTTDYIEIARSYHTVLISRVPIMTTAMEDVARRFIAMIDEFYERNVSLIVSAAEKPESLYQGTLLAFEFERTVSRLKEMQSQAYIARPHLI